MEQLVAHWLWVPGDHGSNPCGGEKIPLWILSSDHMIAVYNCMNSWLFKVIDS